MVQGDETSLVWGDTGLAVLCHLLGVEESQFRAWLCSCKVVTSREAFTKPKNAVEANRAKDHESAIDGLCTELNISRIVNSSLTAPSILCRCTAPAVQTANMDKVVDWLVSDIYCTR